MIYLVLATRNGHKVQEIREILGEGFGFVTLEEFPGAPVVKEDANSFAGNATKKAVELASWLASSQALGSERGNAFALADDSGLEVDALGGAPGVHSARFSALDKSANQNASSAENNAKLLRLLQQVPADERTARFRCVLALTPVLMVPDRGASPVCSQNEFELQTELFEGSCEGRIGFEPRGSGGFGYDPLFVPDGYQETFGELGEEVKNQLSHRARALEMLRRRFDRAQ